MIWLLLQSCVSEIVEAQPQEKAIELHFKVQPEHAQLSIDGKQFTSRTVSIDKGEHHLEVSLEGFKTHSEMITVVREATKIIELEPIVLNVDFWVQSADSLVLEGAQKEWSFNSGDRLRVPYGDYQVTATAHASVFSWTEKISNDGMIHRCIPKSPHQYLQCVWRVACGKAPKSVAFSLDGSEMWVALLMGPVAIEVYDTTTWQKKASIDLNGSGAVEFAFAPDGQTVYVSQMQTSSVYEIDIAQKKVLRKLPTKGAWTKVLAINKHGDRLYASNWVSDDVSEIDLTKGAVVRKWKTAEEPRGLYISVDQTFLYIVTYKGGSLERVNLKTGEQETLFTSKSSLRHIAADEARGVLFISDMRKACIWKHDIKTGQTERFIDTESHPNTIILSKDKRLLFVSNRGRNHPESYTRPGPEYGVVQVFDSHTGQLLDAAVGKNQPTGLDLLAQTGLLASTDFWDANVSIYALPPTSVFLHQPSDATKDYRLLMQKSP